MKSNLKSLLSSNQNPEVGIVSLGCAKNLADMEAVLSTLKNVNIVPYKTAPIILLNTCGFLKAARDEVFEYLNKFKNKKVIILGCLAGKFFEKDFEKYPQIQAVISSANYSKIPQILKKIFTSSKKFIAVSAEPKKYELNFGKTLLTPRSYAYVKIAEGCNNRCSYCLIPYLKGAYRSRKMPDIIEEVKSLIKIGVKEINLVAQDCGYYGIDLYKKPHLVPLLKKLVKIPGDFWIRLLYIYPERIDDELLKTIKNSPKICKYLDIPLQHGDTNILKNMRRPSDIKKILAKITNIKSQIPEITLRTSLIVGFPNETEKSFQNLIDFIKKINFDHVGVFEFSREKGTPAYNLKNQINSKTKSKRREIAMLLQQKISNTKNKSLIGSSQRVLIENFDPDKNLYLTRPMRFAPEIDGKIFVKSDKKLPLNTFHKAKITKATSYDIYAKI